MYKLFSIALFIFACSNFSPVGVQQEAGIIGSWKHDSIGISFNNNHQFVRFNVLGDTILGSTWQVNNDTIIISSKVLIVKSAGHNTPDTMQAVDATKYIYSIKNDTLTMFSFQQNNQYYRYIKCN
jgi:hypothetical protein